MRMMLKVSFPVEQGNKGVKEGILQKTIIGFVERVKPEACYFLPNGGKRTGLFFFDLKDPASIPPTVEPFFVNLNAEVELTPAMSLEEVGSGLQKFASQER